MENPVNGGFNGKIIYFYGPFSMAMLNNQRVYYILIHCGIRSRIVLGIRGKSRGTCYPEPSNGSSLMCKMCKPEFHASGWCFQVFHDIY